MIDVQAAGTALYMYLAFQNVHGASNLPNFTLQVGKIF